MTREEVLELLPLYAGGDLDEVTTAAVRAALAENPSLADEARPWENLDGLLVRALAPGLAGEGVSPADDALGGLPSCASGAAGPATSDDDAPGRAAPLVTVRRRCPFCHDALQATSIALCASCATPHHAACFGQNLGCSLLGCGGTRAVAADGPESVVCEGCERHTPAGAPFCAWCGAGIGAGQGPLHTRPLDRAPAAWSPRRYAAAAALLLSATFGMGGFFGLQQRQVLGGLARVGEQLEAQRAEGLMPQVLEAVFAAQQLFARDDLDGDGARDLAETLESLVSAVHGTRWADFDVLRWRAGWDRHYAVELHRSADGERFCALARPREGAGRGLRTWFVSDEGHVTVVASPEAVDADACRLRATPVLGPEALTEEEVLRRRAAEAARGEAVVAEAAPASAAVEGRVLAVKDDVTPHLVLVSLGADDGVVVGTNFSVYRGARLVATLVVERTTRDSAGCRVLTISEGQWVRVGDQALAPSPQAGGGAGQGVAQPEGGR